MRLEGYQPIKLDFEPTSPRGKSGIPNKKIILMNGESYEFRPKPTPTPTTHSYGVQEPIKKPPICLKYGEYALLMYSAWVLGFTTGFVIMGVIFIK